MLDVGSTVTPQYESLKEVALFLVGPKSLPNPELALGLYISVGGQEWQYRGFVSTGHPTEASALLPKSSSSGFKMPLEHIK